MPSPAAAASWAALAATPAPLLASGADLRLRALTPAAATLLGVSAAAMTGRALVEALSAAGDATSATAIVELVRQALADGRPRRFVGLRPERRSGARPVVLDVAIAAAEGEAILHLGESTAAPRELGDGGVRGFATVVQEHAGDRERDERARRDADATARLVARLTESEERLRLLVEGVREYAIIGIGPDGRVISWNAGGERLFGWSEAEAVGGDSSLIFTAEDRDAQAPQQEVRTAVAEGQATDERWHVRKDGSRFYASGVLTALRDERGALRGFVKIVRDRTADRQAQEHLRTERALLRAVLEQMPVGVTIAEAPSGRVLFHNRRAIELLGHGVRGGDDYRAYTAYGALHPDGSPYAAAEYPIARALLHGEVVEREDMRYRRSDGQVVEFTVSAAPVRDGERVVRAVSTFDDITLPNRDREVLRRVNSELEAFAYIASHDLQEPLRMVASYLNLLRRRAVDRLDDAARQYLGEALDGAQRMQRLVRHLLDFARLDCGDVRLEPTPALQAVAAALHNLERAIDESGAAVTHDDLPVVLAEPEHLVRLFQNLIGNAVKYARPGVPPRVHVSAQREHDRWLITVADNGVGIAPADRERVFRPFERAHGRESYPGTGLGLAICRKIVDRCGGDIRIEPAADGVGSRFIVSLRATDAARG